MIAQEKPLICRLRDCQPPDYDGKLDDTFSGMDLRYRAAHGDFERILMEESSRIDFGETNYRD